MNNNNSMFKNLLNLIFLSFKGYSLLRSYQLNECKNIKLSGYSIEFGAYEEKKKNFHNFFKGSAKFVLSNIHNRKEKSYIKLDLTKKLKIKKSSFQNVLLMNVLEHLPNLNNVFEEIDRILKNKGNFIGSTPFLYQIHGAPFDYQRFTKDFFYKTFSKKKYKSIIIKPLGFGPMVASYGLVQTYLRYFPIIKEMLLILCYFIDFIIQIFVKTKLEEIYPVGYFFIIKK